MKRLLKIGVLLVAIAFVAIQFFQIDKTNSPTVQAETLESVVTLPPDVGAILQRSCSDCHTNTTVYPWYAYVQPFGWFLQNHIDDGKRELNFSKFATYDANKRAKKIEEVCEQVESGEMPLPSYLWIHRDAALTDAERKTLCDWTVAEGGSQ